MKNSTRASPGSIAPATRVEIFRESGGNPFYLEQLMRETGCGAQCGLCRPYLRRMLATGETVFHQIIAETAE